MVVVGGCGARAVTRKTPIYFYIGTKRVTLMDILSNLPQIVVMVDSSLLVNKQNNLATLR